MIHYEKKRYSNFSFVVIKSNPKNRLRKKMTLWTFRDVCVRVRVDVHRYVSGDVSETHHHGYENDIFS